MGFHIRWMGFALCTPYCYVLYKWPADGQLAKTWCQGKNKNLYCCVWL